MSASDSAAVLQRAGSWVAELRERGQVDDALAKRLSETLAESLGERLDREDDPLLVVMLCGPTAVGKSSLINALAGADISRPGLGATTRAAVLYVHEDDDPARLFEYSQALGSNRETELIRHRRDELLHKVLVDTPDIDSVRLQHKELTARLVHAADLVLFVTSPEKYKVVRSARWVLEQRQQRGMAFVLNKWDRQALGLQHERRREVEADFRNVLANEGFPDAVVFKVSALAQPDDITNDLEALRDWLETGISRSTASTIRQRRLRAAWGRLAAAIEPAVPRPLSNHQLLPEVTERLAMGGGEAEQHIVAESSMLDPADLEDGGRPVTPGLLGMWSKTRNRIVSTAVSLRSGLSSFNLGATAGVAGSASRSSFGERTFAVFSDTVQQVVNDAAARRLPLGPVAATWAMETSRLRRQFDPLPLDAATELMTDAHRATLRRVAGIASIYLMEGLIIAVLLMAAVRAGIDFVQGNYAPAGLFLTALELVSILLVVGNIIANLFFPPLRHRLRRVVAQRARSLVRATAQAVQVALLDHVSAVDRLAKEGHDLLSTIDSMVIALTKPGVEEASVNRLFGQAQMEEATANERIRAQEPAPRRPAFD